MHLQTVASCRKTAVSECWMDFSRLSCERNTGFTVSGADPQIADSDGLRNQKLQDPHISDVKPRGYMQIGRTQIKVLNKNVRVVDSAVLHACKVNHGFRITNTKST